MKFTLNVADTAVTLAGDETILIDDTGTEVSATELTITHTLGKCGYYRHGWNSWSPTAWWHLGRAPWRVWNKPERTATAEDATTDTDAVHRSYMVTALDIGGGRCLLIGSLERDTAVFDLTEATILGRDIDAVNGGGKATKIHRYFIIAGEECRCFAEYARRLARELEAQPRPACAVWSSWYSYFEEVTAADIESEIGAARDAGFDVLQIDDGWERAVGDWYAGKDFPDGMEAMARRIRQAGMTPGLWVSPFIALDSAPVVREHPEYFIGDTDGRPAVVGYNWGQPYFGIDTTHPGALQWVRDTIREVVGWGYGYLKLDFLYAAAFAGCRHSDCGREAAYRLGIEAVREAAGEDVYIVGSGAVVAPTLGVFDAIRVGPDTAPYWDVSDRDRDPSGPGLRNALRNSVARLWLRPVVGVDPDVAFGRSRRTLLPPEASRASVDMAFAAGVLSFSDPQSWIDVEEKAQLAAIIAEYHDLGRRGVEVRQTGRYTVEIGGRMVDFEPWINPVGRVSDQLLVK